MSDPAAHLRVSGPITVEEFFDWPDDGNRYEILSGEAFMVPSPDVDHQYCSKELQFIITQHIKQHGIGELFNAPLGLVLGELDCVEPDLMYVSKARAAVIKDRALEGAPDLVVEILSPSRQGRDRDLKVKKELFERSAIPHYWVVDPRAQALVAFELRGDHYVEVAALGVRDVFRPSLFAPLEFPLAAIFRKR